MSKKEKSNVKKPIFKKWWFWLIIVIIVLGAFGSGKKAEPQPETEAITEAPTESVTESQTEAITEVVELSEKEQIEKTIRDRIEAEYNMVSIDGITINDNAGSDAEGDYIALVNVTFNQKNKADTAKEVLSLYSSDLAATLGTESPSVSEVAIFWSIPYLESDAKCSYERSGDGFKEMDIVWGF